VCKRSLKPLSPEPKSFAERNKSSTHEALSSDLNQVQPLQRNNLNERD